MSLGRSGAHYVVLDLGRSRLWLTWGGCHNLSHVGGVAPALLPRQAGGRAGGRQAGGRRAGGRAGRRAGRQAGGRAGGRAGSREVNVFSSERPGAL